MSNNYKKCGNCSEEKDIKEYRKIKEKRVKIVKEYLCSMCKNCEKIKSLENYYKNRDKNIEYNKKYKKENKDKINETRRKYVKKLMEIPEEKIKRNMKSLISSKIRNYKNKHTADYLGKDISFIMKWLIFNMDETMNWDNYGKYWEIDHSIPISLFNLKEETDIITCFCWMNLMPMEKIENSKKSNKICKERLLYQEYRLKLFCEQFPLIENEVQTYIKIYKNKYESFIN